jgi:hypothetical protein
MRFHLERLLQFGTAWLLLWVSAAGQARGVTPVQALLEKTCRAESLPRRK